MTWADFIQILLFIGVIYSAWYANRAMNARIPDVKNRDKTETLDVANTAIERAYKRADEAESELEESRKARKADREESERKHEENRKTIENLQREFHEWKKQRYMIAFTMMFSEDDPVVERVAAYRDRRSRNPAPFDGEEKRGKPA